MPAKPSIVFVHGLWADGSCFSKVIPPLQAEGYQVIAAQHGLDSLEGDVATVIRTIGRVSGPVLLVGHSYGGTLITAAGTDDRVAGLVYIAALAPDETETSQSQQAQFPVTDVFNYIEVADGRIWLQPEGTRAFAGDLSEQEQKLVWATQTVPDANLFNGQVPGTAWRTKPSWYIVANADRTVHPELERFAAKRMGAPHLRRRQQPRRHAVPPRLRPRRHPDCRELDLKGASTMPMIDVYARAGTFPDRHKLAVDLATTLMAIEGVPDIPLFRSNTAAFVHELDDESLSNVDGDSTYVRVQVLTNAGALNRDKQLAVVAQLTALVAAASGDQDLADRTWVLLTEAPDGGWGLSGHAHTNEELVQAARTQIAQLSAEGAL